MTSDVQPTSGAGGNPPPGHTKVVFFIDKAKFEAATNFLTPREILTRYAKEDPNETTLVRVVGKDREKLEELDKPTEVKDGTHFTILHHGPTPVS
jgi:hypothetical protein